MSKLELETRTSLDNRYGGNCKTGRLAYLPESWLPYIQLARLCPPVGFFLILFPHIFGLLLAAILQLTPCDQVLQACLVLFGGSFFMSNSVHIWNDLVDAPLDALVERTRNRPIPRGAIYPRTAFFYTITQTVGALLFLTYMPDDFLGNFYYALPSIVGWTYYPFAKRHTNFPQLVLGFCLAWGSVMGALTLGVEAFTIESAGSIVEYTANLPIMCLFLAGILWATIYDTIYAHQDIQEDLRVGIKSLAVLCRHYPKTLLYSLLVLKTLLLASVGVFGHLSWVYYIVTVGGCVLSLGLMINKVDLKDSQSCWWWFGNGFWFAGGSMAGGLLLEYISTTCEKI